MLNPQYSKRFCTRLSRLQRQESDAKKQYAAELQSQMQAAQYRKAEERNFRMGLSPMRGAGAAAAPYPEASPAPAAYAAPPRGGSFMSPPPMQPQYGMPAPQVRISALAVV